jgi:ADP-ribosyl-[dinitrogen reductase] hydrolase
MKRTSVTHPLEIAAVTAGAGIGRVGITFCPGKHDRHAMSGYWDRDLDLDLDAIRNWGATAVVTLLEASEFSLLRVEHLGDEVRRREMTWFHLPIRDACTPDERFERRWETAGAELRAILRGDGDVLVHCRMAPIRADVEPGRSAVAKLSATRAQLPQRGARRSPPSEFLSFSA